MQAVTVAARRKIFKVRVGDGKVEGVLANEIVPDLRRKTATEAAEQIVARLNLVRRAAGADGGGAALSDAALSGAGWPSETPVLHWPMADHSEARGAFARLLSDGSPERALLVRGSSETGKTHMSKQMIRNAMQLPEVVAGRFDFKGTTNIGVEIEAFSGPLGIEPPPGQTLSERLAKVFTELRKKGRPALLVFDTYEAAGEARDWVESVLLPHLVSSRAARVRHGRPDVFRPARG
jgi:hypothetical protein